MAHELLQHDTMFSVKKRPWHGLGTILDNPPTIQEAIKVAGLDWNVSLKPLFTSTDDGQIDQAVEAQATVSSKTNDILGIVGMNYTPLQNDEAFNFFQPFLDEGLATLETAGSLFNGQKVFITAKINLDNSVIVPGDEVEKFILLSNSHNGTTAVRIGFTPIRVVCNNTLTMAHENKKSKLIKVKHGKNVKTNIESLRDTMNLINQEFEATMDQYRYLASRQINSEDLKKYIKLVFTQEKEEKQSFNNDETKETKLVREITELFETGRGNYMNGVKGTVWASYNAVTEYLTHYRGRTLDHRFNSLWFADGQKLNKRALDLALSQ